MAHEGGKSEKKSGGRSDREMERIPVQQEKSTACLGYCQLIRPHGAGPLAAVRPIAQRSPPLPSSCSIRLFLQSNPNGAGVGRQPLDFTKAHDILGFPLKRFLRIVNQAGRFHENAH